MIPSQRSSSLRTGGARAGSLSSRSTIERIVRISVMALVGIPLILMALRDFSHLYTLYATSSKTVARSILFLHWRSKTFHVESQQVDHVIPWALIAVLTAPIMAMARPGRRSLFPRYILLGLIALGLIVWTWTDLKHIGQQLTPHFNGQVFHQMETILSRKDAEEVIKQAKESVKIAETNPDHDWLHHYHRQRPIYLIPPDVDIPFPWSLVTLFLVILGLLSLRHRYTFHFTKTGRLRFVPRMPDPEDSDANDTWDHVAQSIEQAGSESKTEQEKKTSHLLHQFPVVNPTPAQVAEVEELKYRRDSRVRSMTILMLALFAFLLWIDVWSMWTVYVVSKDVASGKFVPPAVFMVIDVAPMNIGQGQLPGDEVKKWVQRPLPFIREWKPEYPLPIMTFFIIFWLIRLAVPPFHTPRARLMIRDDALVAVPLTVPTTLNVIPFSRITGIDVRFENPSAHAGAPRVRILRHRRYIRSAATINDDDDDEYADSTDALTLTTTPLGRMGISNSSGGGGWFSHSRGVYLVRGYLCSGGGDLGVVSLDDLAMVVIRVAPLVKSSGKAGEIGDDGGDEGARVRGNQNDRDWAVQVQGLAVEKLRDMITEAVERYRSNVHVDAML